MLPSQFRACNLHVRRSIAKKVVRVCSNLGYCYFNHMELNSWLRSLHESCPKHWIDSSIKFQDQLQTQDNKINWNDDYNKNTFIISTTKIVMNKNICMYTYSNTVLESPSPPTSDVDIQPLLLLYHSFNQTQNLFRAMILFNHPQSSLVFSKSQTYQLK